LPDDLLFQLVVYTFAFTSYPLIILVSLAPPRSFGRNLRLGVAVFSIFFVGALLISMLFKGAAFRESYLKHHPEAAQSS
jgi:hypothetical protein